MEYICIEIRGRRFGLSEPNGGGGGYHINELLNNGSIRHCGQIVSSPTGWLAYGGERSGLTKADLEKMLELIPPKPWHGYPYYLTHDRKLLIRAKIPSYAIWEVGNYNPSYFFFEGKNWGLELVAGRSVTRAETDAAGEWLREQIMGKK